MAFQNQFADAPTLGCRDLTARMIGAFGCVRLRVSGTSMVPSIRPGDVLSVAEARLGELSPGEVVVFAREGRLVGHRLVARTGSADRAYLVTRGDRTRKNDDLVSQSEFIGRVVAIERSGRQVRDCNRLSLFERVIGRLLRFSDRATYLYLRLATLQRGLFALGD